MNVREVTDIAVKAGEILLTSGAEIYRVEDTINRICEAYNIKCESFVLPTGIFVSAYNSQGDTVSFGTTKFPIYCRQIHACIRLR
jgi:uncharacterized membrane protein YjjP (DUF1212 family)